MHSYSLGIDTSNYKTSVAITDENRNIIYQRSEFLKVEQGERGLRQSVAFFHHSNVLPLFIEDALRHVDPQLIRTIAVSNRPRNVEGSYMPVFLAGVNAGIILSSSLRADYHTFSHQEGHIEAILSTLSDIPSKFLLFHLSGGTTECLCCNRTANGYQADIVGGTKDISIGQLLDRAGVKLGYSFPAGKYLDEVALRNPVSNRPSKIRIQDGWFNLSGIETQVLRDIETNGDSIIPGTFSRIADLLFEEADDLSERLGISTVVMAGGVAASGTIRRYSETWNPHNPNLRILFGDPTLSGDNAVGISLLGGNANL